MLRSVFIILSVALIAPALRAQEISYRVVVNNSNTISQLSRDQVSKIFLRKITEWDNHQAVLPVDQTAESPVRWSFTKNIHRRSIAAVETWWQQQTFAGVAVAPPERATDAAVLDYVRQFPNAIGYVRADTPLGSGLKAIDITP